MKTCQLIHFVPDFGILKHKSDWDKFVLPLTRSPRYVVWLLFDEYMLGDGKPRPIKLCSSPAGFERPTKSPQTYAAISPMLHESRGRFHHWWPWPNKALFRLCFVLLCRPRAHTNNSTQWIYWFFHPNSFIELVTSAASPPLMAATTTGAPAATKGPLPKKKPADGFPPPVPKVQLSRSAPKCARCHCSTAVIPAAVWVAPAMNGCLNCPFRLFGRTRACVTKLYIASRPTLRW